MPSILNEPLEGGGWVDVFVVIVWQQNHDNENKQNHDNEVSVTIIACCEYRKLHDYV